MDDIERVRKLIEEAIEKETANGTIIANGMWGIKITENMIRPIDKDPCMCALSCVINGSPIIKYDGNCFNEKLFGNMAANILNISDENIDELIGGFDASGQGYRFSINNKWFKLGHEIAQKYIK